MPSRGYRTRNHEWIDVLSALSPLIKEMGLKSLIQDDELDNNGLNFANCDIHCQLIVRAVEKLLESKSADIKAVQNLLKGLLNRKTMVGAFCELAAYDWLMRYDFGVKIQIPLDKNSVLGKSGSIVDGQLSLLFGQAYFDVKSFGFHGQMALRLKERLEGLIPGKAVSIEESWDVSIDEFELLVENPTPIIKKLLQNGMARYGRMTIFCRERQPIMVSSHVVNPYLLAQENSLYPFKYSNQFACKVPFLLIFVVHPWLGQGELHTNFSGTGSHFTRALARRTFMQYVHDKSPAADICDKVRDGVTLAEASQSLSGIVFANIWPKGCDDEENHIHPSWIYLNPRATHPLARSQFSLLYANGATNVDIDDFEFDNYPLDKPKP